MISSSSSAVWASSALALLALPVCHAARGQSTRPLLPQDLAAMARSVSTSSPDEVAIQSGQGRLVVTCRPGKSDYPGIVIKPQRGVWNLSRFGHVEARVTNIGSEAVTIAVRVDNPGDWTANPWNGENGAVQPGKTATIRVRFGYSWGQPGFALEPSKVSQVLLFTTKPKAPVSFRIESVVAGGAPGEKPPVDPQDVRSVPKNGVLFGAGVATDAHLQPLVQISPTARDAPPFEVPLRVTFPAGVSDACVSLKPPQGRWDLGDYLRIVVRVRNIGRADIRPRARLESAPGVCDWVSVPKPVPPGRTAEIMLPFAGGAIELQANGSVSGGTPFESDRASGISIGAEGEGARSLELLSVRASVPPLPALPAWLGKRPPVEGNWKQTMSEEFNGTTLNERLWTIYHPNYWDKQAHISKDNVLLGAGVLRLRFEKKRGHANDDPTQPETDYAMGFITSTHKWTQKYGYFECRMKLPHAPGMWPAFWMMPDRGPSAGEAREDTRNGGMEFDIFEYLARYGPYRTNIACHWDGYEKDHKSVGTAHIYVQPDKDGYYVAGLLWEPGCAAFYCNGKVVALMRDPRVASVPEYILFTAVSGGWGGNTLTGEGLPSDLVIDWVRAWQRE